MKNKLIKNLIIYYKRKNRFPISNPVPVNALGGSFTGLAILILIVLMVWYLRKKELLRKEKEVSLHTKNTETSMGKGFWMRPIISGKL